VSWRDESKGGLLTSTKDVEDDEEDEEEGGDRQETKESESDDEYFVPNEEEGEEESDELSLDDDDDWENLLGDNSDLNPNDEIETLPLNKEEEVKQEQKEDIQGEVADEKSTV
jgi:hypothetical protein